MEQEENEETLDTFKDTIVEKLKDSVFIGKTVGSKSNKLLNKIHNDDFDVNKLEAIALELLNMFNSVKGNMWAIVDMLENKLKKLNKNRSEEVFKDLNTKVLEYKMHKILMLDNKYSLSVPSHKDVQTNFPTVSTNDEVKDEKRESEIEYDKTQKEPSTDLANHHTMLKDLKKQNSVNLSLRKNNDTQDTDDCWEDSINNRSATFMEIWNKRGDEKINATDEDMDKVKKEEIEEEEEELGNRSTPELNCTAANSSDDSFIDEDKVKKEEEEEKLRNQKTPELNCSSTDSSDDTFIDGKSPKREIVKQSDSEPLIENKEEIKPDSESLAENNEEIEPELPSKLEESFVAVENKLYNNIVDTPPNTKKTVSLEDKDDENKSASSVVTICNSNTDISDSEKDMAVEGLKSGEKPTDNDLDVNTESVDSGVETCSKSVNIPLEVVDAIMADTDKAVTEKITSVSNVHETGKPEPIVTEPCDSEHSELNSEEIKILERGPYSVETVKLDSDTEELSSTQNSDSEFNMATQPILDESINVSVQSDQEENKMISPNHTNEPLSSVLTEKIASDNTKDIEVIIRPLNIITEESSMKKTDSKDISDGYEIKEQVENTLEPASDDSLKNSISNKDANSSELLPSENNETEAKQSLDLPNPSSSHKQVLNSDKDENISPNVVPSENAAGSAKQPVDLPPSNNINLNEDANLPTFSLSSKEDGADSIELVEPPNSQLSDSNLDNSDVIDKTVDAEQSVESSNLCVSNINDLYSDKDNNLAPNSLTSKGAISDSIQSLNSPHAESSAIKDLAQQFQGSPNTQLSETKQPELNEDEDCVAKQSLELPIDQSLALEIQLPDAKHSSEFPNPHLTDLKESNPNEDIHLPCNSLKSNDEATTATRSLASPNVSSLEEQNQEPDAEQPLNSPDPQLSDQKVSNSDKENMPLISVVETCAIKQSPNTESSLKLKVQISNDSEEPNLDDRALPPNSLASKDQSLESSQITSLENNPNLNEDNLVENSLALKNKASESNKPLESCNSSPNSLIPESKAAEAKQSADFSSFELSGVDCLESGENINLSSPNPLEAKDKDFCSERPLDSSNARTLGGGDLNSDADRNLDPNSLAAENEICIPQPSPNPQSTDDTQNKLNSEKNVIMSSDSDTIILTESDTEQELEVCNSKSLENVKVDRIAESHVINSDGDEENLSQGSNKSFEFDITENLKEIENKNHKTERNADISAIINSSQDSNDIDYSTDSSRASRDTNKIDNGSDNDSVKAELDCSLLRRKDKDQNELILGNKSPLVSAECENANEEIDNLVSIGENDNRPLKDIAEELEAVLSQKIENEVIGNDSDATVSDIDYKGAGSLNVQSSDEFNSIGKNESEIYTSQTNKKKSGGVKEIIEVSDSDDEVHLDVTMEEIISDGSSIEQIVTMPVIVKSEEDIQDIKPSVSPECISSNEQSEQPEKENADEGLPNEVGDELLELLREVEVPVISKIANSNKSKQAFDKKEAKDADEIFRILQEESSLEMTDSDVSEEEFKWDAKELELSDSESDANDVKKLDEEDNSNQGLLNKCNITECYVRIERLNLKEQEIVLINKSLNDSIDRLCDIDSLINKRKYSPGDPQEKSRAKKLKKAHKSTKKGTSDSESLSDISNSDNELCNDQTHSPILAAPLEQKLDDLLANEICKGLKSDSDLESDEESDDSRKSSKRKKKGNENGESCNNTKVSKPILSKEEQEKKAWKNDPLLRGKLNSDSDISTGSEKSRKRKKRKYEHDTDFNAVTEVDVDSGSDCSEVYQQNKAWLEEKLISPIKKNIPLSDSSDSDSDCEFVPQRQSPQKNADDEEAGPSCSQKGRRNIRALMSDESLAEATRRANKEEQERIERLEDRHKVKESLSQSLSQVEEEDLLILDVDEKLGEPLITVHRKLTRKLKPHQRIGIQFMWDSCYESVNRLKEHDDGSGCILAHCMGLGKTFQVIALIHTLFAHDVTNTKHVLVVCPLSTVNNWKNEVKIAFNGVPDETLRILTIGDKKEISRKYEIVKKWQLRKKCVLVLGYEGFESVTNEAKLEKAGSHMKQRMLEALVDPGPDLVICDEGHLLRNKKALKTLALNKIRTKRRIVLTGTPLQNNLLEYYYMVQFVKPNLLGTMKEYKTNFVNPITNGQYEDSTEQDIKLMMKRSHVLHKLLKKTIQRIEDSELKMYLPNMVDHAVFVQLHQVQVELYHKFSEIVTHSSEYTNNKRFLSDYYVFQYIGTHPHLLSVMDKMKTKRIKERDLITNENENDNPIFNIHGWWKAKVPEDSSEKIEYGNKLVVVKSIIEECEEIGDKVLVFSQCLGELDLIEHFLKTKGTAKCPSWQKKLDYFRMDGTVLPEDRSIICDKFNEKDNKRMRLLLMSTKVGGLGLNLTAANRVIIMTVNWNPSFDTQSVFRVYRFGQEKKVFVYRLISLGTMEEKVYQRTVTKLAVAHRVVDKHQITRHYKSIDLQELYSSKPNADEERPSCNVPEDKVLAKLLLKLPFIFKYHEHQALLANRPEDNLNEQELNAAWDEFKKIKDAPQVLPPPLPALPQLPLATGPTYAHAYALTNKNKVTTGNKASEDNLVQYYIPKLKRK